MTIESPEQFVNNLWDWGILDGCFGESKIKPTDVDGLVERNGHFLILEAKSPTAEVKQGQEITFQHAIQAKSMTVFVVWGEPGKPERLRMISKWKDQEVDADIEKFREKVSQWYEWANRNGV